MKMNLQSLIITSCFATGVAIAQETMELKINATVPPTSYHQVALAGGFTNANAATVDLFGKNGKDVVSIPNNYVGSQEAAIGDNYFGVISYYGTGGFSIAKAVESRLSEFSSDDAVNYAEFIQTALPSGLTAGKDYEISFKVSLADKAGFATGGWGVYFSADATHQTTNQRLTVAPQVSFTDVVTDKNAWTELKAKFTATGSEKNMILGVFDKNYKLQSVGSGSGFAGNKAYYYVSSIMIKEIPMDRDKDGVLDKDDKCPDVFGLASLNGCPDADGDGITDADDKCPSIAGIAKFNGCPDTDGDGIPDAEDKCPKIAGLAKNKGCPIVEVDKKSAEVFKKAMSGIQFESGKDVIKKTSYPILENVVSVLKNNPTWNTEVNGHTDNTGNADKNKALSEQRAIAVMNYLKEKGVTNKLKAFGFGSERPVADNNTAKGRAENRRVAFIVSYEE